MADITYDISATCGVLSEKNDWRLELNLVSWNKRKPTYDLRKWHYDDYDKIDKMGKGVTMTKEELRTLYDILKNVFEEEE